MGFSSYKSYGVRVGIPNILLVPTLFTNNNFINLIIDTTYRGLDNPGSTILPNWTVDTSSTATVIISRSGSPFYPSSNRNLPSGYTGDYTQTLSLQTYSQINTFVNVYQEFFLASGIYTISFYASYRNQYNTTSNVFSIYI